MNNLPQEIYDEIAIQFETVIPYRPPRRGGVCKVGSRRYDAIERWYTRVPRPDIDTLRILRLVSKSFNAAATPALFRCTQVLWWPGRLYGDLPLTTTIKQSLLSPNNPFPIAKNIKNLKFLFSFRMFNLPMKEQEAAAIIKTQEFINQLSPTLSSLSELNSLEISTGFWFSRSTGRRGVDKSADNVDIPLLDIFVNSLSTAFITTPFPQLTKLDISLPCTHNYSILSQKVPDRFWQQLKSLFLAVSDATGPGGSRQYTHWTNEYSDGDDAYVLSNLQQLYPNRDHASSMFDIVARCPNLETLGIESTHRLNGDLLTLTTPNIKALLLHRLTVKASKLIELLSPTTITRFYMEGIELTEGTWADVFQHLLQNCNKLHYLNPSNCSYARGGSSFHLRAWNGRLYEDTRNLWSIYPPDESSLIDLVHETIRRAGGSEKYPNLHMEQDILL